MTQLIYNTLSGKKEEFKSIIPNQVKMYLCGPTVYDFLHIGNFRGAIVFNLIRNWLEFQGNKVTMVYNYTDVDDKIIKRANDEGVECSDVTERFIKEFEKDFHMLGLRPHDHNPRVTEHMTDIIEMIEGIVRNQKGYVVDGEVFFDTQAQEGYGKLSKKKLDELEAGHRVDVDGRKKHPSDFVLWKPSKPGEPSWDSPWGKGRPGWHIECSAMVKSILGETIDIHGGGIDLIFPHHENEIAQSEGCNCTNYCNYWVHNEFINFGAEKMSKSLGNVITARNFMETYHPEILKYLFLSAHYRTQMSITDDKLMQTISALTRIYSAVLLAQQTIDIVEAPAQVDKAFEAKLEELDKKITESLSDDFNTAEMISFIFEGVRAFNALGFANKGKRNPIHKGCSAAFVEWMKKYGSMSALFNDEPAKILGELDDVLIKMKNIDRAQVEELIAQRTKAREDKDWAKADEMRDKLAAMDIELLDGQAKGWRVRVSD
ncbi:MAG: cysteine--tRNA ligase [Bdellovibrionota bacterium]|nr:cysteine--tRNA ligase [Bdellovibrionota bacterium]